MVQTFLQQVLPEGWFLPRVEKAEILFALSLKFPNCAQTRPTTLFHPSQFFFFSKKKGIFNLNSHSLSQRIFIAVFTSRSAFTTWLHPHTIFVFPI